MGGSIAIPQKLKELRLMAKPDILFLESELLHLSNTFRHCLQKLGLAHITIAAGEGSWSGVLEGLRDMQLERLWLFNPRHEEERHLRLVRCDGMEEIAKDVRFEKVEYLWVDEESDTALPSEYPGFGVFE
jgi:hypothetical protein